MKILSIIFLVLGAICAVGGFLVRFFGANIPIASLGWIYVTNTLLLFSITVNMLIIVNKKLGRKKDEIYH